MAAAGKFPDMPSDEAKVKADIENLIKELDSNKDGKIQWTEVIVAMVETSDLSDEAALEEEVDKAIPADAAPALASLCQKLWSVPLPSSSSTHEEYAM
jgi:hypothetical protein